MATIAEPISTTAGGSGSINDTPLAPSGLRIDSVDLYR